MIFLSPPFLTGNEAAEINKALSSGYITSLGPSVDRFEEMMREYTGYPYALAVSSGTAALHLILVAIGVAQGDLIWAPSFTFIGGVSPAIFCGAKLEFFDSCENWTIDANLVEKELSSGRVPQAIIATDIYGISCDHDHLKYLSKKYKVPVITDAAESLGSLYNGTRNAPEIAFYSFNGNKIITTSSGGMIVSHDKDFIQRCLYLSRQAKSDMPYYHHEEIGYNYRMSNLLAAVGIAQLSHIDDFVQRKKNIFNRYKNEIADAEFMPEPSYDDSNKWLSVMMLDKPCDIMNYLYKHGIEARRAWKPMHLQPIFKDCVMHGGTVCESVFARGLCLPSGCGLRNEQQDFIIEKIKEAICAGPA